MRGDQRARYVADMFVRISRRYDLLNTVMTAGRHYAWRRMSADLAVGQMTGPALDVATGTGDFAIDLARKPQVTSVVGLDFAGAMLAQAIDKTRRSELGDRVSFVLGDAHALPFPDDRFVCVTAGFGVRNFVNLPMGLWEMCRVTRPAGRVVVLEIVQHEGLGVVSKLFPLYFRYVTPWVGSLLAGDREAYTYLPESVRGFITAGKMASMMMEAGLEDVTYRKLALGAVAIHVGKKRG